MITEFLKFKHLLICIGFILCVTFMVNNRCHGYIMPSEQLIEFMVNNFSKIKTLVIIQSTLRSDQGNEKVFREQIWMKYPNLLHSTVLDQNEERREPLDMTYRQLLIANSSSRPEHILSMIGLNLQNVAFTRIDGIVAYKIGG